MQSSLQRQKGEPIKSNRRLQLFTNYPYSLEKFAQHLKKEHTDIAVTHSTLLKESAKWKWTDRIQQHKKIQEEKLREEIDELFKTLNHRSIHDMKDFFTQINELKEDTIQRWRNEEITSTTVFKTLQDYIQLYRQATEIYYINSRNTLQPQEENKNNTTQTTEAIATFVNSLQKLREEQ